VQIQVAPDKVAVYIRWSTEDQGQGHTLEIQRESSRYYAMSQGWAVRDELTFIDEGFSGGNLKRPALTRLRQHVKEGRVQCVIVYKLDRLSRNIKDIINLVLDEWDELCCVRSTQEPVDTTSDAGKMFFTMLGSFADFERSTIKTRTWSGKLKNAEKGRNPGIPYAYGYQKGEEDGAYALVDDEAAVVREIYDLYIRGMSCQHIAWDFNKRGLPTRAGRGWQSALVAKIIRNPIYIGRLVFNQTSRIQGRKQGKKVAPNAAEQIITVDGVAPPIIETEFWEQAQRVRSGRPRIDRPGSPRSHCSPFLLSGFARCTCGHPLMVAFGGIKGSRKYYYCSAAQKLGNAICAAGMIAAETLEEFVVQRIRETWPLKGPFREQVLASANERLRRHEQMVAALHQRMAMLGKALDRFKQDYKAGQLTGQTYSELTEDTRRERENIAAQLAAADATCREITSTGDSLREAEGWYAKLDEWTTLELPEQKQVIQMLVASVQAYRQRKTRDDLRVHIDWRLPRIDQT
jgi:site-specific DNA recombinase